MKVLMGWMVSAGLVVAAASAHAQIPPAGNGSSPYIAVSDIGGPYAAMSSEAPVPGDGPRLLPGREVYTVVRENGFSPLGMPLQRGFFYTIAVIDRDGEDGRLVIDARDGRIVRFVPAYRVGYNSDGGVPPAYGPSGPLPPINSGSRGVPRPPASVPHVASRSPSSVPPLPKAMPPRASEPVAKSDRVPPPQSMAMQAKPAKLSKSPQNTTPAPTDAQPAAPQILPTQAMPKVQGLD